MKEGKKRSGRRALLPLSAFLSLTVLTDASAVGSISPEQTKYPIRSTVYYRRVFSNRIKARRARGASRRGGEGTRGRSRNPLRSMQFLFFSFERSFKVISTCMNRDSEALKASGRKGEGFGKGKVDSGVRDASVNYLVALSHSGRSYRS